MFNDLKFLMRKRSTWQKVAAERGVHVYVYGHHYFGFAVKVKLQGNANIERNLIDRIDQVMQQDNENLFFQYFVDKEKNYYLVVMYETLKKIEIRRKFWNLLSMTGAVKTRTAYFIFLPMICLGLNYSKNMSEKKTCIFQRCNNFYRYRT